MSVGGPGASPEGIGQGLRDSLLLDGRRIIIALYNDRTLLPDEEAPRPLETIYRNRSRSVDTLFGPIELRRHYHHHAKSGTGRCPLDDLLGLDCPYTAAVARLMCRAASRSGSYLEASQDLAVYAGLALDPRDRGRLVGAVGPRLGEALAGLALAPSAAVTVPVLCVSCDGTGTPVRREELRGIKGKGEDGTARTRASSVASSPRPSATPRELL